MNKKELIHYACKELFEIGNIEIIDEVFVKSYVIHTANKDYRGYDFIKKWFKQLKKAFLTIYVDKIDFLSQENNLIVWQRSLSGKHIKQIRGIKPSDKIIKWNEMVVSRFEDGKIAEEWVVSELKGELFVKHSSKIKNY